MVFYEGPKKKYIPFQDQKVQNEREQKEIGEKFEQQRKEAQWYVDM